MDRVDSYHNLLPQYLKGDNIRRHCNVIETMDKEIYTQIMALRDWNVLTRPIMIQRIINNGKSKVNAEFHIHIQCKTPIKRIRIWQKTIVNPYLDEKYKMEDMTTEKLFTYNAGALDKVRVMVETYNDIVYTKQYPENDAIKGNSADHDEYLDMIGRLLGIPRKEYIEYNWTEGDKAYPPYFHKQEGTVIPACTEDDYYYSQRLRQFVEMKQSNLLDAYTTMRYNKESIVVTGENITFEDLQRKFPDYVEEHDITGQWLEENKYSLYAVYLSNEEPPVNYKHTFTEEDISLDINRLLPCTRLALITLMETINPTYKVLDLDVPSDSSSQYVASVRLDFGGWKGLDFTYSVDGGESNNGVTDNDGRCTILLTSTTASKTFNVDIKSTGQHGEYPMNLTLQIPITWYSIDTERYVSHDEMYLYSSDIRPMDGKIQEGYSKIITETIDGS